MLLNSDVLNRPTGCIYCIYLRCAYKHLSITRSTIFRTIFFVRQEVFHSTYEKNWILKIEKKKDEYRTCVDRFLWMENGTGAPNPQKRDSTIDMCPFLILCYYNTANTPLAVAVEFTAQIVIENYYHWKDALQDGLPSWRNPVQYNENQIRICIYMCTWGKFNTFKLYVNICA